jgi:hypothetical protein
MSNKRASSVASWWSADHQLLLTMPRPPGGRRAAPRARLITVCARPPRGAGSPAPAQWAARPAGTIQHTQTHTRADTRLPTLAWKHPLSSSLAGSGIVNLCLSCVFSLDVRRFRTTVFGCLWPCFLLVMVVCLLLWLPVRCVLRGGGYYLVPALSVAYLLA